MSETVKFSLVGVDDVQNKMLAVSKEVRHNTGRFALRKVAVQLAAIVKANAERIDDPSTDRSIPANVTLRFNRKQFEATGMVAYRVGIRGGAGGNKPSSALSGNPGKDTRYWRHLEFGTQKTRAQPFMRKSLAENINPLTKTFIDEFGAALTRAIRRAGK